MDTAVSRFAADQMRAGKTGLLLVDDNCDAFALRVLAARGAMSSLDLMYYIWHDDHTGRLLMREVVRAAERGVKVRLILDDINPRNSDAAYLAINSHPNIQLRLFNPSGRRNGNILRKLELVARMFALTRRMHNKAWIADNSVAIVGGRNIGDAYFDAADTNFRDLDLLMVGAAVEQTSGIFEAFWNSDSVRPIQALHPPKAAAAAAQLGPIIEAPSDEALLEPIRGRTSIAEYLATNAELLWTENARVISDPPEKARGLRRKNWLTRELLPLIQGAGRRLEIVSPYFIPGRKGTRVLSGLVRSGVNVAVLTNSLAATDVAAVHGAYANYRKKLLRNGVKLYELQPFGGKQDMSVFGSKGASLHTKAFLVDDRIGFVGSFNFDPRSVALNSEMGVLVEDARLVEELQRRFTREKSPQTSYVVELRGNKLLWTGAERERIREYDRDPEAGLGRRLVSWVVRWLPIESQL